MSYSQFLYVANKLADLAAGTAASTGAYLLANARIMEHSVCSGVGAATAFFMNVMACLNYIEGRNKYTLSVSGELREAYAKKQTRLKQAMGASMSTGFIALVVLVTFFYKDIEHMGTNAKTEDTPLSSAIATVIATALPHLLRMSTECIFDLYFSPTEMELLEATRQQFSRIAGRVGAEGRGALSSLLTTASLFMGFNSSYLGEYVPQSGRSSGSHRIVRAPS